MIFENYNLLVTIVAVAAIASLLVLSFSVVDTSKTNNNVGGEAIYDGYDPSLRGDGIAFVCVDTQGQIFRSDISCDKFNEPGQELIPE